MRVVPFSIPDLQESLHQWGQSQHLTLPAQGLSLLVWNVYKGKGREPWKKDFLKLSEGKDLILLQEAMIDDHMPKIWSESFPEHHWKMAASFEMYNKMRTGVATGSRVQAAKVDLIRSSEREFFIWTPKVSLGSRYQLADSSQDLLVINTHVVNFTTTAGFNRYIHDLLQMIQHHTGPLILAGDFNTWNGQRWENLLHLLEAQGLYHVPFERDPRFLRLDHVFLRGLKPKNSQIHSAIRTSDHFPLELELEVEDQPKKLILTPAG